MAKTQENATFTPRRARTVVPEAGAPAPGGAPKVQVNVPRAFHLADDDGHVHEYGAGRQPMPVAHAEHFYAKANGVTIKD